MQDKKKRKSIRNFCIIAHIDHGKSTLADRMLQLTKSVSERDFHDLMLDDMDLERERGITIKASCVRMFYEKDGQEYELNLIDTPGHVDFSYEVSRALKACEGALLLVDASQGIEAQTVVNYHHAVEQNLAILPVVTKIDLPMAQPIETMTEIEQSFALDPDEILPVSGKTGRYVGDLMDAIVEKVPPPSGNPEEPLSALIFDSTYDDYRGVIVFVRVFNGVLRAGDDILMMGASARYEVSETGVFTPSMMAVDQLEAGQVGYVIANIKNIRDVVIGDTLTHLKNGTSEPLPGYIEPKPVVFSGFYPEINQDFASLRAALEKLSLNDSSFDYEPESSEAMGFGFRCGFLGLLHMEIIQQRLERESQISVVQTAPNVSYEIITADGKTVRIDKPSQMPDRGIIEAIREPFTLLKIITPSEYVGNVMKLVENRRGEYVKTEFFSDQRAMLEYNIPLAEIIYDFFDRLKSGSRGHATMDYEWTGYRESDLVKVDILVNETSVDALSFICHRDKSESRGRQVAKTLKQHIERHMFAIPIQAAIGGKIIARETVPAQKKNVTAKCYGGDITRKRKLWARQKEGKNRMKSVGNVSIPQKAFMAILDADE